MASTGLQVPLVFVTEAVAALPTKPPVATDLQRSHMVEVLPDQALGRHVDNTAYEIMGMLAVHNKPDCPYDFDSRFLTDLVDHVEHFNKQLDVPRDLKKTRFVVVLHVGRGVGNYWAASLILDKVVPFSVGFKRFFPCSAIVFTGPPTKIRPNYVFSPTSTNPQTECTDYWSFFDLRTFVHFVNEELSRRKPVSDANFLLALRTPDVVDFYRKYMLPRSKEFFSRLSPGDAFEVANAKQFAIYVKFVVSRVLASQTDEILGPQVHLAPVHDVAAMKAFPHPQPQNEVDVHQRENFQLPAVDQDYRSGANVPRKRPHDIGHHESGGGSNSRNGEGLAYMRSEVRGDSRYAKDDTLHVFRQAAAIGERGNDGQGMSRDRDLRRDDRQREEGKRRREDRHEDRYEDRREDRHEDRREDRDRRRERSRAPEHDRYHSGGDLRREFSGDRQDGSHGRRHLDDDRERGRRRSIERVEVPFPSERGRPFVPPFDPPADFDHRQFEPEFEPRLHHHSGPSGFNQDAHLLNGAHPGDFSGGSAFIECQFCGLSIPHFELEPHLSSGECCGRPRDFEQLDGNMVQCRYCKKQVPSAEIRAHIRSPECVRIGRQPSEEKRPVGPNPPPLGRDTTVCRHCQSVVRKADIRAHVRSRECLKMNPPEFLQQDGSDSRDFSRGNPNPPSTPLGKNMTVCRHCQEVVHKAGIAAHIRGPDCRRNSGPDFNQQQMSPPPLGIDMTICRFCEEVVHKADIGAHIRGPACRRNNSGPSFQEDLQHGFQQQMSPPPLGRDMTVCRHCQEVVHKTDIVAHIRGPDCRRNNPGPPFTEGLQHGFQQQMSPPPLGMDMTVCRYCDVVVHKADIGAHIRGPDCQRNNSGPDFKEDLHPGFQRQMSPLRLGVDTTECRFCGEIVRKADIRHHISGPDCARNKGFREEVPDRHLPPRQLTPPPSLAMNMTECRYCQQLVFKADIVEHIRGPDCARNNAAALTFRENSSPVEYLREPSPSFLQENTATCRYCDQMVPKAEMGAHIHSIACTRNNPEASSPRKVLLPHPESDRRPALLATPEPGPSRRALLPAPGSEPRRSLLPSPTEKPALLPTPDDARPGLLPRPAIERRVLLPHPDREMSEPPQSSGNVSTGDVDHLVRDAMRTLERMPDDSADASRIRHLIGLLSNEED